MNKRRPLVCVLVWAALLSAACGGHTEVTDIKGSQNGVAPRSADVGVDDAAATSAQVDPAAVGEEPREAKPTEGEGLQGFVIDRITADDHGIVPMADIGDTSAARPTTTSGRPGRFSDFNGADTATWQQTHAQDEGVACYERTALPLDSFCLDDTHRSSAPYSQVVVLGGTVFPPVLAQDTPSEDGGGFVDIAGNSHEANIRYIVERGLTVGCDLEGPRYCPSDPVTRAQMAAFLVRALGLDTSLPHMGVYPDVPEGTWYTAFVETLGAFGLTDTQLSAKYRPSDFMLRSEMAVFLQKAFRLPVVTGMPTSSFEDIPEDSAYAGAAEAIFQAGVTRGCSTDPLRYCPNDTVRRDTMASFLARSLRLSHLQEVLAFARGRETLQTISVGQDTWNVWVCDDAPIQEDPVAYLNREISSYFRWLSGGRHQMSFRYGTDPPADVAAVLDNCDSNDHGTAHPEGANVFIGVDLSAIAVGAIGLGGALFNHQSRRFSRNIWMDKRAVYDTTAYAHEIGHTFGWPHNHRDRNTPASQPLHTRMDIMASLGQVVGTNAHNLFQTGWIDPDRVRVHLGGTATYTITPPHQGGATELLMLPLGDNRLISIGARTKEGFDRDIAAEGVELYDIELCGGFPGCKHIYLPPGAGSNDPVVLDVGNSWGGGIPTVSQGTQETIDYKVSVQSRQHRSFTVELEVASTGEGISTSDSYSSIGVGRTGVCGLLAGGTVRCWDWRGGGSTPTGVFTSVSVGHTACGTRVDGSVECWGRDNDGSQPPEGPFTAVDVNGYHACGHLRNGTVECWGSDPFKRPMAKAPEGEFTAVSPGWAHACGMRPDMSIECWGRNHAGETSPPTGAFTAVSAGGFFSCALRPNGTIACWGSNLNGKSSPPTGDFIHVGTGWDHACGILSNGTVACWGNDHDGEASPPQGIFTSISVGDTRSCGIRIDGSVECWGRNR